MRYINVLFLLLLLFTLDPNSVIFGKRCIFRRSQNVQFSADLPWVLLLMKMLQALSSKIKNQIFLLSLDLLFNIKKKTTNLLLPSLHLYSCNPAYVFSEPNNLILIFSFLNVRPCYRTVVVFVTLLFDK